MTEQALTTSEHLEFLDELAEMHAVAARTDGAAFCSYVLKNEETAQTILNSPIHEEWHWLADRYKRLILWAHVEAGKTQQMAIGRSLYELGRNPNLRIVICSNTHGQAEKSLKSIQKYVTDSLELRNVFPEMRRDRNASWNSSNMTVQRETRAKDPSIQITGLHGNILGSRIDLLIMDDILDYENTLSERQREDLWAWYHSTLETRLTREARILCIGTAWHRDDAMHRFAANPVWTAFRYPVLDDGEPTWPEQWPGSRIEEKRVILGPVEFARQLLCVARSDEDSRFKVAWVNQCKAKGEGKELVYALSQVPPGYKTYTGVDLGVRTKAGSDLTCLFTIAVAPNEDRIVLNCDAGRWGGPEIVDKIIDHYDRYQSIVIVENNAAQEFILQFTKKKSAVPVMPYTTGTAIRHPEFGLEALAAEMANGKWVIPCRNNVCHPEVDAWINELLYYDPRAHAGDRLMASWFAREGARMTKPKIQHRRIDLMTR